jgi:hypothetical protein
MSWNREASRLFAEEEAGLAPLIISSSKLK